MPTITFQEALSAIREADGMNPVQLERLRNERLSRLVCYAKDHSPYFGELYRGIDPEHFTLGMLPSTGKAKLSERLDDWFTDRRLNRRMIENYQQREQNGLLLDAYTVITTSGSSGTPLIMVRDACHNTVHGALMQTRLMRGLDANLLNPAFHRIASVIFTSGHCSSYSSFLKFQKEHPDSAHNMIALSTLDPIPVVVGKLNDFNPAVLTGYPSVLVGLAREQQAGKLHLNLQMIACSAEVLTDEHYRYLKETFGCPVINNYCSTEGGELAMSCSEGHLHINTDWVIIEPVDEQGNPAEEDTISAGVLITDLTNFVQPVIRYYVDDHARIIHKPCPCGSPLPIIEVLGRQNDSFIWNGRAISSAPLDSQMPEITGLLDYQFVQSGADSVCFHYEPGPGFDQNDTLHTIRTLFERFLAANDGEGIRLTFVRGGIAKNPSGGKNKHIVNLCKQ